MADAVMVMGVRSKLPMMVRAPVALSTASALGRSEKNVTSPGAKPAPVVGKRDGIVLPSEKTAPSVTRAATVPTTP